MYVVPENCQIKHLADIYERYFGNKENGVFVDIGAYDGYTYSNVWGMVKKGWSGVCVEPNSLSFKRLVKTYEDSANVLCLHAAAGKIGTVNISLSEAVSSTSEEQIKHYKKHGWVGKNLQYEEVVSVPLNEILKIGKINTGFELLSLDTEGTELEIIQGFDIDFWQPQMVIIEAHEKHPIKPLGRFADAINQYFADHRYRRIYNDVINNIYWR